MAVVTAVVSLEQVDAVIRRNDPLFCPRDFLMLVPELDEFFFAEVEMGQATSELLFFDGT